MEVVLILYYQIYVHLKKPKELTFKNVVTLLNSHFCPKPSEISERYKFRMTLQAENETVSEFLVKLRKLSMNCKLGDKLDEAIHDQFVCGIKNDVIKKRLLQESDLTYKKAVDIATTLEIADTNAHVLTKENNVFVNWG